MNNLRKTNFIWNNQGSVMLTVLISFMFISVLVAIIMPLTVMAYRMKAVERQTKDEFYYVERALNDVYSGIGKECSFELGRAYSNTLAKYDFTDNTFAYEQFHLIYVKKLVDILYDDSDATITPQKKLVSKMNLYLTSDIRGRAEVNSVNDILFYDKDTKSYVDKEHIDASKYNKYSKIKIEQLHVASKNRDFVSSVTTDMVIEIPTIDFFKVNEKELDYALVGCKGIEFLGDASVIGNVYGGAKSNDGGIIVGSETTCPSVTINADYVVSGSNITVNQGNLSVGSVYGRDNEIWFENLILGNDKYDSSRTAKANIDGNLYALNDLQVEGKGADVTITGNYYGYGDEGTTLKSKESIFRQNDDEEYDEDMRHSQSSSIIVNSSAANLDMSNIRSLVLLGQAYIDHNSKYDAKDSETYKVYGDTKMKDDGTGESASIKASQELLLVPEEFLDYSNPTEYTGSSIVPNDEKVENLKTWVSKNFSNVRLADNPIKDVKLVKNGSKYYAYLYLNFDSQQSEKNYIDQIINCDINKDDSSQMKPSKQTMKRRILFASLAQGSSIKIGKYDAEAPSNIEKTTRIYTKKGTVLFFDKDTEELDIRGNTTDFVGYDSSSANLYNKYTYLDTYLDFNSDMSKSVNATAKNDEVLPFGRLFWKKGIQNDAGTTPIKTELDGVTVLVYGGGDELDLNDPVKALGTSAIAKNALVIVDGDVRVTNNTIINGFIICSGKITVNNGAELIVNSDLSSLQKRINAEIKAVRGNITSNNPTTTDLNNAYEKGYLIRYLLLKYIPEYGVTPEKYYDKSEVFSVGANSQINSPLRYLIKSKESQESTYNVNSDYTQFITLENWKKTGAGGQ